MFDWLTDPAGWAALVTLTAMEVVLGIDNVVFISVLVARLPEDQARKEREVGIMLALVLRVLLLSLLNWIIGMTKTIARAYAAEGILAFAVAPGFTVSEMTEEYLQGRGGAAIVADIPLGRVASTDEVAEVIRWLATEAPASSTGSTIDVNGASYVR